MSLLRKRSELQPKLQHPTVLAFATQGAGSNDDRRLRELFHSEQVQVLPIRRDSRFTTGARILKQIAARKPDLVIMEGTGVSGGIAVLISHAQGVPFVICSGDAIGPFIARTVNSVAGVVASCYERILMRRCAGFIGWTPYLTGRALQLGAKHAITVPGWGNSVADPHKRQYWRARWGITEPTIVFGIVGSIKWNVKAQYCYGLELLQSMLSVCRQDVAVVIVGDGDGLPVLKSKAAHVAGRVVFAGRVEHSDIPGVLAGFDIASLPSSLDGIGMYRYTTKLPEYVAAGLPVVTGQLPFAYDLDSGWIVRLPGGNPWDPQYVKELGTLMSSITVDDIKHLRSHVPLHMDDFDRERQRARAREFVSDILARQ